jgi:hypothetical protein
MEKAIGDLTFLTDGSDYACIWHPSAEDYKSRNARLLATIAVKLINDQADFNAWKEEVQNRWRKACETIFTGALGDITIVPLNRGNTN